MMTEIITIGDEILIGQIVDTNSAWMGVELNKAGFEIAQITSVHDDENHIVEALENALQRADVVLFTGGIGPTKDDITKHTLAKFFKTELVFNEDVLTNIENLFSARGRVPNELTRLQAMVPANCTVIQNRLGTAPITWFDYKGKVVVSMPGVPYEMKNAMSEEIIPRLQKRFKSPFIYHKTLIVVNNPESVLAKRIESWEDALPVDIKLAYLPNFGIVKLRLSGKSFDEVDLKRRIDLEAENVKQILGDDILVDEDLKPEMLVGRLLHQKQQTLATAESCTGGYIAHKITLVPGSSAYFKGSVVAYSNDVKAGVLQIDEKAIEQYGAVSQQVVEEMARNVAQKLGADYAVATSGIAGPGGGTIDKPVGLVWIAIRTPDEIISRQFQFNLSRELNIDRTYQTALLMLIEELRK